MNEVKVEAPFFTYRMFKKLNGTFVFQGSFVSPGAGLVWVDIPVVEEKKEIADGQSTSAN